MLPCSSTAQHPDDARSHAENMGYIARGKRTGANEVHLLICQFCASAPLAATGIMTTLRKAVLHIGTGITKKEMPGVAARRIIAAMKNEHAGRYVSDKQLIHDAVCSARTARNRAFTISPRGISCSPKPAIIWAANLNIGKEAADLLFRCNLGHSRLAPPTPSVRDRAGSDVPLGPAHYSAGGA